MSSTSIVYRGRIVFVPETVLICVGYILFDEAAASAQNASDAVRFAELDEAWHHRATQCGVGCADLALEQLLQGDPQREREFLAFIDAAHRRLHAFGNRAPAEYVERVISRGIPEYKGACVKTEWLHKVLDLIKGLIKGEPIGVPVED